MTSHIPRAARRKRAKAGRAVNRRGRAQPRQCEHGGGARGMLAWGWRRERERASLPNQQRGLLDHPA